MWHQTLQISLKLRWRAGENSVVVSIVTIKMQRFLGLVFNVSTGTCIFPHIFILFLNILVFCSKFCLMLMTTGCFLTVFY